MIKWTNNYSIFDTTYINRNVEATATLRASMERSGFIPAYPLDVQKNKNGRLVVRGGHHRLHVAKSLGIKVAYVVTNDIETVYSLEGTSREWTLNDWFVSHRRNRTSHDYEVLARFLKRYPIPLSAAIDLLHDGPGTTQHIKRSELFKRGELSINDPSLAIRIGETVCGLRDSGFDFVKKIGFISALKDLCRIPIFDERRLVEKARRNRSRFTNQPTKKEFLAMIEDVYNFRSVARDRVPLAHLSEIQKNEANGKQKTRDQAIQKKEKNFVIDIFERVSAPIRRKATISE